MNFLPLIASEYFLVSGWSTQQGKHHEFHGEISHEIMLQLWVCLKIGYIPNYSHLIGIMISKTIGKMGYTIFRQTHLVQPPFFITGDSWPGACTAPSSAGPTTNGAAPRRYARRCAKVGRTRGCQVGWRGWIHTIWLFNIAIENGHRNSGFSHEKWWFSIVT